MNQTTWVMIHSLKTTNFLHIAFMDNKEHCLNLKSIFMCVSMGKKIFFDFIKLYLRELQYQCDKVSTSLSTILVCKIHYCIRKSSDFVFWSSNFKKCKCPELLNKLCVFCPSNLICFINRANQLRVENKPLLTNVNQMWK